jgi:hypothetical protein
VLRRSRQRPSERRERGGSRRRRGSPRPRNWTAPGCGAKRASPLTAEGANINAQLAQVRELEAKLAEEYRVVRLLRASIAGEASTRGERARELGKQARERINVDFDVDNPNTPPRASQKLVGTEPAPQAAGAHRASDRTVGRELGVSHSPTGERAGRWGRAGPRGFSTRGRHGGAARQPKANAGQGADP